MTLTFRELWATTHGIVLGSLFLLAFAGGLAELYSLRSKLVTNSGIQEQLRRLRWGTFLMAIVAWATVITGTYIVYPWYRAPAPEGADLSLYPRSFLKASDTLHGWHSFGMEWKEHVAWFTPILATTVAYLIWRYGPQLAENDQLRKMVIWLFVFAFATAGVAGLLGALITKAAPIV